MPDGWLFRDGDPAGGIYDPTPELVGAATTPLYLGPAVPAAEFSSNISVHPPAEEPIDPSQSYPPSDYGPGM